MVSFCDYKLSEIGHHVLNYGSYGLGMAKDWGVEKGLNPVLYVSAQSPIGPNLKEVLFRVATAKSMIDHCDNCQGSLGNADIELSNIYAWTKNYEGVLLRNGIRTPGFRFADDKEWRYVADINYGLAAGVSALFRNGYSFIPVPSIECPDCKMPAQSCPEGGARILKERQIEYEKLIDPATNKLEFSSNEIRFVLVKTSADKVKVLNWVTDQTALSEEHKLLLASKVTVIDDLDFRDLAPAS